MFFCAGAGLALSTLLLFLANAWSDEKTGLLGVIRQFVLEMRRNQALYARSEMIARSLEIKREVTMRLLSGRLDFRQALEQFHEANAIIELADLDLLPTYKKPADSEGEGRQVLAWARKEAESLPLEKARRVLVELENQYKMLFGRLPLLDERGVPEESSALNEPSQTLTVR